MKITDLVCVLKIDYWEKNGMPKVIVIAQGGDDGGIHQHDNDGSEDKLYGFEFLRS